MTEEQKDIWPLKSNLSEIDSIDDTQVVEAKLHLESRSGFKFDILSIQYILEEYRLSPVALKRTLYEFATKNGMISKLRTKTFS